MERRVLRFALALLICASGVWAQTFSVKGVLRDPGGRTVDDGTFKMEFRLYEVETGGTKVWSEIQANVPVQHGVFSAELGVVQPLAGVSFLNPLFLGIAVEGHPEMAPRIKILPGPYSMAVLGVDNRFPSTGNVGVNTTSPTEPLEVAGNLKLSNGGVLMFPDGTSLASADLGGTASSAASPGNLLLTADNDATGDGAVQLRTGSTTQVTVTAAGDVGIGTTTPSSRLSVNGDADITGNVDVTGNVGIGTSTPANPLSVTGSADISGNLGIGTTTTLGAQTPGADLALAGVGSTIELGRGVADKDVSAGQIGFRLHSDALDIVGAGSAQARRIRFWAEQGVAFTGPLAVAGGVKSYFDSPGIVGGSMTIDGSSGRVGIGTSTPANPLSLTGNADIRGRVRIGTTIPANPLSVTGNANITGKVGIGATNTNPAIDLAIGDHDTGLKWNADGNISVMSNGTDRIRIAPDGRVGINSTNPVAALHVKGPLSTAQFSAGYYWYWGAAGGVNSSPGSGVTLAYFEGGDVICNYSFVTANVSSFSDARSKHILGVSDGAQDLKTLQGIEVTDFKRIDERVTGGRPEKKVIAQQVEEVYPQAVSRRSQVIPSVYQPSDEFSFDGTTLTVTTGAEHGFAVGDRIDVYTDKEELQKTEILSVPSPHSFVIAASQHPEHVFVYGKWVDDFRVVDYEAIAMLNVSATQELAQQLADLSARAEVLAQENAQLKAQVVSLAAVETEKATLEARLAHMEDAVVRVNAALQRLEEKNGAASGQVLLEVPSATLAQSR